MTPADLKVAGGQPVWTRDSIHEYMRDYASLYGADVMTAAAFNPSTAKWRDDPVAIERYYDGNPLRGGKAWPSLNTIKKFHDGSFNAARVAAGFEPNTPGPASRRRARHTHSPVRDIRERVHTRVVERTADTRWGARLAERDNAKVKVERVEIPAPGDARLRKQVTRVEQRLATATERLRDARENARKARETAARGAREVKAAERRTRAVEATLAGARARIVELGKALHASQAAHTTDTEKLAMMLMAEETSGRVLARELGERDEALAYAEVEVDRLREQLTMADPRELARISAEVESARAKVASANERKRAAEALANTATRERRGAEARAERAEREAAVEVGRRQAIQRAVAGHTRPLKPAEVAELRRSGPQGPAVFMAAVKGVVNAQSKGERAKLREALREAAAAAVSWADRL